MKKKVSVSIEEKTIDKLDDYVKEGQFRNKSHVIEFALNKYMRENENEPRRI
jgi:Arc/MetJ-type ribon-helix-helix transcriptional regulator